VAANTALRERVADEADRRGLRACIPRRALCADNAAMVGAVAHWRLEADGPTSLGSGAWPNLALPGAPRRPREGSTRSPI
jgi:N6-L-threonylcarbamoyladenine synthase